MDFSEINDSCLKSGFKLNTNLSAVGGNGVNELMESLSFYSMKISNMRIIERIMYAHPFAFKTQESIKEIMRKSDPVINAFTSMGNCDRNCNMKWLIAVLNQLREFRPLQNIVATGPPLIKLKSPISDTKIESGNTITFEISTISKARIKWWKNYNGQVEIVSELRINEFTVGELISYKTEETDKGHFHIEVTCKGGFRKLSPWIQVGNDKSTESTSPESTPSPEVTTSPEIDSLESNSQEITPSPEYAPSGEVKRLALLIGIMDYKTDNQKLKAPETDIFDLERVLLQLGFTVYCFGDLNFEQMKSVLKQFSNLCEVDNTIIFFYFAGHGARINKGDNLELIDKRMPIKEVLEKLVEKKPKMAVSLFDMCRDNSCENITGGQNVHEVMSPFSDNLIVLMSTLPTRKAYEKPNGCENTSLIMKPLCDSLSLFGSKYSINYVLAQFITSCENIEQTPTLLAVPINEKLGIDILNPRITLKLEWVKNPENQEIMKSITIDYKIFHNFVNIYINKIVIIDVFKSNIRIGNNSTYEKNEDGIIKINLFNFKEYLKMYGYLEIVYQIFQESKNLSIQLYPIRIFIPKDIISFL